MKPTLFALLILGILSFSFSDKNAPKIFIDTQYPITGIWVSENYYNKISVYKSPKDAQENALLLIIPQNPNKSPVMIYNFHDGSNPLQFRKSTDHYEIWEDVGDNQMKKMNDMFLQNANQIKIGQTQFRKIKPVFDQHYKILEELLFKGEYQTEDNKPVKLEADGKIIGLDRFSYYEPMIDYIDAGRQVNQIGLGTSPKDIKWYGFSFKKNVLELYDLHCLKFDSTEARCWEVEFGKKVLQLRKIK